MKNIIKYTWIICLLFVLSCEDKATQAFGSLQINLETERGEVNTNDRSSSQLDDYNIARITINGTSDTISLNGTSASYSKSGIPVGAATVSVELLNISDVKYSSSTSVQIQADDVASVTLNNWFVENQQITFTQSMDQSYDQGDTISFYWDNTHSEQTVSIYYMTLNGSTWQVYGTIATDFTGNSTGVDSSNLPAGPGKIRIESDISSVYAESSIFQLNAATTYSVSNLSYSGLEWYAADTMILSWDIMDLTWNYDGDSSSQEFDTYICSSDGSNCALVDSSTHSVGNNGENYRELGDLSGLDFVNYYMQGKLNSTTNPRIVKVCAAGTTDNCDTTDSFNIYYYLASGDWAAGTVPSLTAGQSIFLGHLGTQINNLTVSTSGGSGDVDIFIYEVSNPFSTSVSLSLVASSENSGNSENASISNTGGAYYLVAINGYSQSSDYSMNFTYSRSSDGKEFNYSNEGEVQKNSFD
jgi:hypothetical protein